MTCQICNKESGEYSLCPECFELMQKGEVKKCIKCNRWYKSGSVCNCIKAQGENQNTDKEKDYSKASVRGLLIALGIVLLTVAIFIIINHLSGNQGNTPGVGGMVSGSGIR